MSKKRGLGRGLDALLGDALAHNKSATDAASTTEVQEVSIQPSVVEADSQVGGIKHMPVEFIQPGQYQPRKDMHQEALEELAASIKAQGLMQPIVIRPLSKMILSGKLEGKKVFIDLVGDQLEAKVS